MRPSPNTVTNELEQGAGKCVTGAKRGKMCNRCQARENVQLVLSTGKCVTAAKRGKIFDWCHTRKNVQL